MLSRPRTTDATSVTSSRALLGFKSRPLVLALSAPEPTAEHSEAIARARPEVPDHALRKEDEE